MGGRVASLSGICFSATIVAPYQIAAFFTCLVTLPFASSCEIACSMLWFIHVIISVNTHLRRRIFIAVQGRSQDFGERGAITDERGREVPDF